MKYYKKFDNSWIYECDENSTLISPSLENNECIEITKEEYDALVEIEELKAYLTKTDYIVIKISETIDDEEKSALRNEYKDILEQRKQARIRINQLEQILS